MTTLTITGPDSIGETDADAEVTYTVERSGDAFTAASTEITLTLGTADADSDLENDAEILGVVTNIAPDDVTLNAATVTFAAGDDAQTFTVTIIGDDLNEPSEIVTIVTSGGGGGVAHAAAKSTVINDDDAITYGITTSIPTVSEGGTAVFTFVLSGETEGRISTGLITNLTTGTATSGDYTVQPAGAERLLAGNAAFYSLPSQGFTAPDYVTTVSFDIAEDMLNEADETLILNVPAAVATFNIGSIERGRDALVATVTITDNDPITVSVADAAVTEGDSGTVTMSFPVTLSGASGGSAAAIEIPYTLSGTATGGGTDYDDPSGTLTVSAMTATANIDISVNGDVLDEANETIVVTLGATPTTGPDGGMVTRASTITDYTGTGTITDNDPVTVSVAAGTSTVNEGESATFTVSLSNASAAAVMVPWTVNELSDADVIGVTGGALIFAAGTTTLTQDIVVPIGSSQTLDDTSPSETLTMTLGALAGGHGTLTGTGATATATVSWVVAHTLAFDSPELSLTEGATATYTVTRTGPPITGNIVVSWTYAAGTTSPAAAADFAGGAVPAGSMLTFTGSETSQTFTIATAEDATSEPDESFTLGLTATPTVLTSEGGVGLPADISIVIGTSDQTVTLSVMAPGSALTEGTAADFAVSFPESVTTTAAVTVDWAISFPAPMPTVTPAEAADFTTGMMNGTASIPAGMSSVNVAITARADMLNEAEESFIVTLSAPAGGGAIAAPVLHATPSATAAIAASDPVTVSVAAGTSTVSEGGSATFTVSLSNASTAAVMVPWTVNELSDADVIGVTGDTLTFDAGTATLMQDIVVPIGNSLTLIDTSSSETLTITLGTLAGGHGALTGTGATAMATVSWVTAAHAIAFSSPPASVAEGASATFAVTRSGPAITGIPIVVSWAVAAGSAMPDDFAGGALPGGMVTFTGSETMQSFVVATQDDNRSEMSETFTIGLSASSEVLNSNGGVAPGAATGAISITDNDIISVSLTGPASVGESAPATYTVTLSAAPSAALTMSWAVAAGTPSGDVIAAADADFERSVFPTGMLTFAVGVTSQSFSFTTTAGALRDGSTDNTPNRAFTITLSAIMGGGGMTSTPPAALAATIREDDPGARTVRMEQAATTLNRATAALSVPVIARRFDPGRGLSGAGLALNLGGKQVLAPPGGVAGSAGAGAGGYAAIGLPNRDSANRSMTDWQGMAAPEGAVRSAGVGNDGGGAAAGGYAGAGGYAAIGLPKSAIPAPLPAIPAKAGIQHTNSPAPAGHQSDAGVGAVPAPVAGAVLAQTPGGALSAAPGVVAVSPPAADGQGSPSQPGPASLNMGALAELAASQLGGLDSLSSGTESRTLQQLLGNSGFSATSDRGGGRTLSVWGRGSYTSLDGEPEEGGNRYDYEGDSYAFYLGLDGRYGEYLAGLAVGYTVGDLELRTAGAAAGDRSDFESDLVAVYPYASWQPSDRLSVWVLTGYGQGELDIEERTRTTTRKATSDTDLWLGAVGLSWRQPTVGGGPDVLLRFSGTALHGETDGGRFDDNIAYAETETDAQQLRGEVELGQVFGFGDGGRLRPYLTAGASYDFGDGARDAATGEFGAGFQLHWPRLGLETEWEGEARLTSKGDRDYREYTGTGTLRYDLGNDRRGLQLALRPAFGLTQGVGLGGSDTAVVPLDGGAFGAGPTSLSGGGSGSGPGSGSGSSFGLHSELSYGIGNVRALRGLPGLLTLYGAGGLSAGSSGDLYRGGVRFEAARFTLDAGLRRESGGGDSDTGFLLDSSIRF